MRTAPRIGSELVGWRRLAVVAALADAVILFGYGLTRGDREALVFAVIMVVGLGLLRRHGLLGLLVMAALFVNIEIWMFPAANGNATYRAGLLDLLARLAGRLSGRLHRAVAPWSTCATRRPAGARPGPPA